MKPHENKIKSNNPILIVEYHIWNLDVLNPTLIIKSSLISNRDVDNIEKCLHIFF
ncbi:MAG: hypothetical protein NPMRTH1_1190021 [Nitrosopumilales archaeon]|nr:MAG: hypothetical protein NPMRTH1_1190021 [Nitrosopumilales archaeon]